MIDQALRGLLTLCAAGTALVVVSRVWLTRYVIGGLLSPAGRHSPTVYQVVRTPGNMVHELSHAAGYLLVGFKVRVRFWFNDPGGRGYAEAYAPYAPWSNVLVARLVASPAPLLAGAVILQLGAGWLRFPGALAAALRPGADHLPRVDRLEEAWTALRHWLQTPDGPWQAVAFVCLAVCLGIDLAPSREDLRALAFPLVILAGALFALDPVALWLPAMRPGMVWIDGLLARAFSWLVAPVWWALFVLLGLSLVLTPLRWLVVRLRR